LIRRIDHSAPRLDKLGEQATAKILSAAGQPVPSRKELYIPAMVGDIIGNTIYYSLAGARMNKATSTAGLLGIGAGLGALKMPANMGLSSSYTDSTPKRRWLTVGLYLTGGLVAAGVMRMIDRKKNVKIKHIVAPTKAPEQSYKPVLDITV
jgi:hypothetical protein